MRLFEIIDSDTEKYKRNRRKPIADQSLQGGRVYLNHPRKRTGKLVKQIINDVLGDGWLTQADKR